MSDLAERLRKTMNEQGVSQEELGNRVGVSQQAIGSIISGKTRNPKNILEIATALNVDPHWLKTGEGKANPVAEWQAEPDDEDVVIVELLDIQAAANPTGIINHDYPEVIQQMAFTPYGFLSIVGRNYNDNIKLITVPTDSMSPTINIGDVVFVDLKVTSYIGEGIYIFVANGETFIKRLQLKVNGNFRVISDNPNYQDYDLTPDMFDTVHIVGKFIRVLPMNPVDL